MPFTVIELTLGSAVATGGTFTAAYPDGKTSDDFAGGVNHKMVALQYEYECPTDFTVSLGASSATITYNGATTLPAGSHVYVQLDEAGEDDYLLEPLPDHVHAVDLVRIELGSPDALDADGIVESVIIADDATLDGALVEDGVATFDVPRNVVITGAASVTSVTFTITGTDVFGDDLVETITGPTGATAASGKKAFKTVTAIAVSATTTAAVTVGTGDVLGLPVYLPSSGAVLKELQDGASATAGTVVAGLSPLTKSTAATADVRGTYDPNAACDGSKAFALIAALSDPRHLGNPQYGG